MFADIISPTILNTTLLANTVREYLIALAVFAGGLIVFYLLQRVVLRRLQLFSKRTKTDLDDTFIAIVRSVKPPFYSFVAFYVGLRFLSIHPILATILDVILLVWVVYLIIQAVQRLIDYVMKKKIEYGPEDAEAGAARFLSGLAKWILWAIGGLLVLSNLGVNVTSLIAGLGIGGVAIAFALQNILGDLFSSFAIYFDKPFVVGDTIKVGEFIGEVQKIGIKTTRVRSVRGEEVVFSNNQLTSDVVQNFGRMEERRADFVLGLTYDTPQKKLEAVPKMIEEVVGSHEKANFDRAHFKSFGDYALEVEVAFYIQSGPSYKDFLDVLEAVNFAIRRRLKAEGISLAFPTQTINLHNKE